MKQKEIFLVEKKKVKTFNGVAYNLLTYEPRLLLEIIFSETSELSFIFL